MVTIRPENIEIVALWLHVCHRWIHVSTGMGSFKSQLDWWFIMNVALLDIPRIGYAPQWKKKQRRKWFIKGLQIMEVAALSVFIRDEKKRQAEMKKQQTPRHPRRG